MSWTVITKYIRPNTGVDWNAAMSDEGLAYIQSNYVDNGKRTSSTSSVSDNELEVTKTFVFRDNAAYHEYMSDSTIKEFNVDQLEYNLTNNIDVIRSSAET